MVVFFSLHGIKFLCIVVAICNLVHDVGLTASQDLF